MPRIIHQPRFFRAFSAVTYEFHLFFLTVLVVVTRHEFASDVAIFRSAFEGHTLDPRRPTFSRKSLLPRRLAFGGCHSRHFPTRCGRARPVRPKAPACRPCLCPGRCARGRRFATAQGHRHLPPRARRSGSRANRRCPIAVRPRYKAAPRRRVSSR